MTNAEFDSLAFRMGFDACFFLPPVRIETSYKKLVEDPASVLPEVRTVILLIKAYKPGGDDTAFEAVISPYYRASHAAYKAAKELAALLTEKGYKAIPNVQVPLKKLMVHYGIGTMGKNSLVAIEGFGSAFHVQAIVTDAAFEYTNTAFAESDLPTRCLNCNRCIDSCPTRAIHPGARVDVSHCIRAISELDVIPHEYEQQLANHVLGCDICQSVCPVNARLGRGEWLNVSLKKLLAGDIDDLKEMIGSNYARISKLKRKAAVVAANTKRNDLMNYLKCMAASPEPLLSQAARHAIERLEENK